MRLAVLLLLFAAPLEAQAPDNGRTVHAGVYNAQQAAAGEAVFRGTCGNCHPSSQFRGPAFDAKWKGQALYAFFDQLRTTMPMDNPGGMSREEYLAVIAYILKLNGQPEGASPLPEDDAALKQIRYEPRKGGQD